MNWNGADATAVDVRPRGADDRALLAEVAAALLGLDPRDVVVTHTCAHCGGSDHGQPGATARAGAIRSRGAGGALPAARAHLSLARAGDLVAVAGRLDGPVGIDIEALDRVASAGFDDVAFTARERTAIADADEPDLLRGRLWTAKEALLKAAGTGLRIDPREIGLEWDAAGETVLAAPVTSLPHIRADDVRLRFWQPRPGYVASLAEINAGTGTR